MEGSTPRAVFPRRGLRIFHDMFGGFLWKVPSPRGMRYLQPTVACATERKRERKQKERKRGLAGWEAPLVSGCGRKGGTSSTRREVDDGVVAGLPETTRRPKQGRRPAPREGARARYA